MLFSSQPKYLQLLFQFLVSKIGFWLWKNELNITESIYLRWFDSLSKAWYSTCLICSIDSKQALIKYSMLTHKHKHPNSKNCYMICSRGGSNQKVQFSVNLYFLNVFATWALKKLCPPWFHFINMVMVHQICNKKGYTSLDLIRSELGQPNWVRVRPDLLGRN